MSTLAIASYCYFAVSVTKSASASQRSVVDNLRSILIWIFFLTFPTAIKENFVPFQLLGFLGLVIGTLIYNEIFEIPFFKLNEFTVRALKEKEIMDSDKNHIINVVTYYVLSRCDTQDSI